METKLKMIYWKGEKFWVGKLLGREQTPVMEYDGVEYHTKNPYIVTKHAFSQQYLDYDVSRQMELESYGYRFLRLNKVILQPEEQGDTRVDIPDRILRKAFMV